MATIYKHLRDLALLMLKQKVLLSSPVSHISSDGAEAVILKTTLGWSFETPYVISAPHHGSAHAPFFSAPECYLWQARSRGLHRYYSTSDRHRNYNVKHLRGTKLLRVQGSVLISQYRPTRKIYEQSDGISASKRLR